MRRIRFRKLQNSRKKKPVSRVNAKSTGSEIFTKNQPKNNKIQESEKTMAKKWVTPGRKPWVEAVELSEDAESDGEPSEDAAMVESGKEGRGVKRKAGTSPEGEPPAKIRVIEGKRDPEPESWDNDHWNKTNN